MPTGAKTSVKWRVVEYCGLRVHVSNLNNTGWCCNCTSPETVGVYANTIWGCHDQPQWDKSLPFLSIFHSLNFGFTILIERLHMSSASSPPWTHKIASPSGRVLPPDQPLPSPRNSNLLRLPSVFNVRFNFKFKKKIFSNFESIESSQGSRPTMPSPVPADCVIGDIGHAGPNRQSVRMEKPYKLEGSKNFSKSVAKDENDMWWYMHAGWFRTLVSRCVTIFCWKVSREVMKYMGTMVW